MARPLRIEFPGAVYLVTSRGDRREPIFVDDEDRRALLEVLASGLERFDGCALTWCFVGNHYHFVLQTRQPIFLCCASTIGCFASGIGLKAQKPVPRGEQSRIDAALKQAAAHARKQLAAQGLKLPTQGWKRGAISNPVSRVSADR